MTKKANLFIVGAPKCGTSALAAYLEHHPKVFLTNPKEPFYWCFDYPDLQKRNGVVSINDYHALFEEATDEHSVLCEGSTNYLRSTCAIERILHYNPDAKFIVMLRNPVDVVNAWHSELLFSFNEDEPDVEKAWALQAERALGHSIPETCEAHQFLDYAAVASYANQVETFMDLVPAENRRVIIFDDFAADNRQCFNDTLEFLGLEPFHMETFERVNASHGHRFPLLSKLILDPPVFLQPLVNKIRSACRGQEGLIKRIKMMLRKPTRRSELRPDFRNELCEYFSGDVARLSELLGRDLNYWVGARQTEASKPGKSTHNVHLILDVPAPSIQIPSV